MKYLVCLGGCKMDGKGVVGSEGALALLAVESFSVFSSAPPSRRSNQAGGTKRCQSKTDVSSEAEQMAQGALSKLISCLARG